MDCPSSVGCLGIASVKVAFIMFVQFSWGQYYSSDRALSEETDRGHWDSPAVGARGAD